MSRHPDLAQHAGELLRAASLAPSSHNTQPWRFCVLEDGIELRADRSRALPVNDPDDRELTISCGCALLNLRAAAASRGIPLRVEAFPRDEDADLLARIAIDDGGAVEEGPEFADALLERRRTDRRPFAPDAVDPQTVQGLRRAAEAEGAWLRPVQEADDRDRLTGLVAEGDAAQWADPSWRRELAAWMRPRRRGDGLAVPAVLAPIARAFVAHVNVGRSMGKKDAALARDAPLLAVLGTGGDAPPDWLTAGQALQRVLLVACAHGLQASYLNQPVQVAALRSRLRDWLGRGDPQIVLRIGASRDALRATARRDLAVLAEPAPGHRN